MRLNCHRESICFQPECWNLILCESNEPQCLYCEWLYCVCRSIKLEQLVGEGSGSAWMCVSWKTNRAVIIFIPLCSCFFFFFLFKGSGQSSPGLEFCQETRVGENSFSTLGMKNEQRPRNVECRLNGRQCSIFHELMWSLFSLFSTTPGVLPLGGNGEACQGPAESTGARCVRAEEVTRC